MLAGELCDFSLCRILSQGTEEVAQRVSGDGAGSTLVEQREGLSDFRVLRLSKVDEVLRCSSNVRKCNVLYHIPCVLYLSDFPCAVVTSLKSRVSPLSFSP